MYRTPGSLQGANALSPPGRRVKRHNLLLYMDRKKKYFNL